MTNWKHYAGSIILAGLLLQGCGSTEESPVTVAEKTTTNLEIFNASSQFISGASAPEQAQAENELTLKVAALDAQNIEMQDFVDKVIADNQGFTRGDAYAAIAAAMAGSTTYAAGAPSRAISFDSILDPIKDGLVGLMDTSVGGAITSATFDVVLNSEGVTVVMLDMARGSETMTQIMIDALGRDWSLTEKMCPMLQTNKEFGEKFAALAEESEPMARFFFERVDAPMYGCLTDGMLLSNDDADFGSYDDPVFHSTNGYMGILMERYATDFFIQPGTGVTGTSGYGRTDTFAGLMFTTGDVVALDGNVTTGHGDANELINEQFFYSTFKTAVTTDTFVAAMKKLPDADVTMFMDEIFLGQQNTAAFGASEDKVQGYYNIISIAGGMYEGIQTYGFTDYSGAFIGFAGLIPADRYLSYGSQFMSAGYFWAEQNGISVWSTVEDGVKDLYAQYTTTETPSAAPARSAERGVIGTGLAWGSDIFDIVMTAWDGLNLTGYIGSDLGALDYYNNEAMIAYSTVIGGPDSTVETTVVTTIDNVEYIDTVKGIHGLLELAIREDMVNTGGVADMPAAETAFSLPAFSDITWTYAYTAATQGVTGYWNNVVDADWLANLSTNELVRNYFYPSADNLYIPSWLMAVDWLTVPANMTAGSYEAIDVSFDGGYMDVYFVSTNADLLTNIELETALAPIKGNIEFTQIDMGSDSIIAVDASGQTIDGLFVYKIRVVTPADVDAVLAALGSLGNSALNAIGINTDNATQTVAAQ